MCVAAAAARLAHVACAFQPSLRILLCDAVYVKRLGSAVGAIAALVVRYDGRAPRGGCERHGHACLQTEVDIDALVRIVVLQMGGLSRTRTTTTSRTPR